jgi:hypothetical protein
MIRYFNLIIFCFLSAAPLAHGQGVISLNVWPPRVDLNVTPGESRTGLINVNNRGLERVQVFCQINDVSMDRYGNLLYPEGGTSATSCEPWMSVNPENFFLSQGTSQQVRYTLKVPENAAGTYLASAFFQTKPQEGGKGTGSRLSARLGVLFILTVSNTGFKDGELSALAMSSSTKENAAQVELGFLNKGNILIRPKGTIEIKTEEGFTVSKVLLNEENQAVLPRSERVFRIPLSDIKSGIYNLFATVDFGGSEILSGESRVNLIVEASRHSWPIPQSRNPIKKTTDKDAKPAVKASPEEVKAMYDLATRQYASGDYEASLTTWQKLLRADPAHSSARKNMERTKTKIQALKKIKG